MTEAEKRYFAETARVLRREGFQVEQLENGHLNVVLNGQPLCEVNKIRGIMYRDVSTPERFEVKDRALKFIFTTAEYMRQIDFQKLPPLFTNALCASRVMEILLDNAIKFVDEEDTITVSALVKRSHVEFCVRDTGIGISPENLQNIFRRFYKVDIKGNAKGSGLGLAIARETLAALNEKIWVESAPGKGSAFYFTVGRK